MVDKKRSEYTIDDLKKEIDILNKKLNKLEKTHNFDSYKKKLDQHFNNRLNDIRRYLLAFEKLKKESPSLTKDLEELKKALSKIKY